MNDPLSSRGRVENITRLEEILKRKPGDAVLITALSRLRDTTRAITAKELIDLGVGKQFFTFTGDSYDSKEEYDSLQRTLPKEDRDGWLLRRLIKKGIDINEALQENPDEALNKFLESLLHRLPYMLFISLPLFALILKLVYIRRKQFYFSDHGVFTIHLYVFSFLLLMVIFGISKLVKITGVGDLEWINVALFLLLFFYLYKAMRNFYGQRRAKTFIKFLMVALLSLIMMLILFVLFLIFSAVTF